MSTSREINDGPFHDRPKLRSRLVPPTLLIGMLSIAVGLHWGIRSASAEESPVAKKCPGPDRGDCGRSKGRLLRKKTRPLKRLLASCLKGTRCCPRAGRKCCPKQPAADLYAWKSLFDGKTLDGWKVPNFGGEGEVHIEDGAIVMETGSYMTGVTWKGEPPRENYELELEGMRLQGSDFFCTTTFPVGDKTCSFVVGGWGGTVTGLSNVDFYDAIDNLTTDFIEFKDKQWYRVRIRVTKDYVRAWIGDRRMVNQEREGHTFGIRDEVYLCQPLGISTWDTTGAVRNIRIRLIDPTAEVPEEDEAN